MVVDHSAAVVDDRGMAKSKAEIEREIRATVAASDREDRRDIRADVRVAELIAGYGTWKSTYGGEDFDRAQSLARELTDIDRQEGRAAPPNGYSVERLRQAAQVVKDANLSGRHAKTRWRW